MIYGGVYEHVCLRELSENYGIKLDTTNVFLTLKQAFALNNSFFGHNELHLNEIMEIIKDEAINTKKNKVLNLKR